MSELKPCPFCGGNNCGVRAGTDEIWCVCGGHSPHGWNSRPIEDALRAENEKLKSVLNIVIQLCSKFNRWSELGIKTDNGETLIDMIENTARKALNEVTK